MKQVIILLLILIPISGLSQTIEHKLEKPEKLYLGTPFHVLIDITTNSVDSIFAPEIDTLDIFILKDIKSSEEIEKEYKITKLDYTFQPFDTGEFTFPELKFAVKSDDSISFIKTSEFILNIESVLTDSSETIKDIAKPLKLNLGFWNYFLPIIALFLIIVMIKYLMKLLKKKPEKETIPEIIDKRSPYQIALELLEELKKDKLLEKDDFLIFYFKLSFILRLFIELNYRINAVEMTTTEIRENLQLENFKEKTQIIDFLTFADKIKFAKFIPEIKESEESLTWLENYLRSFEKETETKENKNA
ncbi:MAG: hypothetical protein KAU01_00975 [Candidatus Cloacimonetes bacterium]|nr:hypothetical protein [Candidatus Cloacimonadota bacterium]